MIPATPTELQCNTPSQLGTERTLTIRPCSIATRTPPHTTTAGTRHCFVSLLSDDGMPIEQISRLVGHSGTSVTELVYRKQIRPVVEDGAGTMDRLFPTGDQEGLCSPQSVT